MIHLYYPWTFEPDKPKNDFKAFYLSVLFLFCRLFEGMQNTTLSNVYSTTTEVSSSNSTNNLSEYVSGIETVISSGPILDKYNDGYFSLYLLPSFIYACVLLSVGIPGNGLVVYVYGFKSKRTVAQTFILTLAVIDLANCSLSISTELFLLRNFWRFDHPEICKLSRFVTSFCNHSTTVVLLSIAIDRYRKIRYPLKNKGMALTTAYKIVCFAVIFGCITGIPFGVFYGTKTVPLKAVVTGTQKKVIHGKTCLPADGVDVITQEIILIVLSVGHVLSDVILVVLYSCAGKAVVISHHSFRHAENRAGKTQSEKRQSYELGRRNTFRQDSTSSAQYNATRTNTMLFLVTLVFIVSFVPYLILAFLRTFQINAPTPTALERALQHLFLRSYFLNSAINPILYCFVSKPFREEAITGVRRLLFSRSKTSYSPRQSY